MTDRWGDVTAGRRAAAASPLARTNERRALQKLTASDEWQVFLAYMREREWRESANTDQGDPLVLARGAGRRSYLRDLEGLQQRLLDDGAGQAEPAQG